MTTKPQYLDGYELARNIASWLPAKDQAIAMRIVIDHERQAKIAKLRRQLAERTQEIESAKFE